MNKYESPIMKIHYLLGIISDSLINHDLNLYTYTFNRCVIDNVTLSRVEEHVIDQALIIPSIFWHYRTNTCLRLLQICHLIHNCIQHWWMGPRKQMNWLVWWCMKERVVDQNSFNILESVGIIHNNRSVVRYNKNQFGTSICIFSPLCNIFGTTTWISDPGSVQTNLTSSVLVVQLIIYLLTI